MASNLLSPQVPRIFCLEEFIRQSMGSAGKWKAPFLEPKDNLTLAQSRQWETQGKECHLKVLTHNLMIVGAQI